MENLQQQIAALPTMVVAGVSYLSYRKVTDAVAAFLFPAHPLDQIDAAAYQRILETSDALCHQLGYQEVVKLTPPAIPFSDMGLYWSAAPSPPAAPAETPKTDIVYVGPGQVEMMQEGLLLDARLSQLGLDEVTRQHFNIPVTASEGVIALLHRAVQSPWLNDYKGIWHDILGMCIAGGKDVNATERHFTVIIRGLGQRRYWRFKAQLRQDSVGAPFLLVCLAEETGADQRGADQHDADQRQQKQKPLFPLGHVVMTPGAAALEVDFNPYLARHAAGDWGALDAFDRRQNDTAVREGHRILSAYEAPSQNGETERIWIITEADRSTTTILLPEEY